MTILSDNFVFYQNNLRPLHLGCLYRHNDVSFLLMENGADLQASTKVWEHHSNRVFPVALPQTKKAFISAVFMLASNPQRLAVGPYTTVRKCCSQLW